MKFLKASGLVSIFIFTMACNDLPEKLLPAFQVNIPPINLSIPPIPSVSDKEIPVGALRAPINMDSAVRANTGGTMGAAAVHFVKVKQVVIKAVNADSNNNLSNFESARIRIFSDTSSVDIATILFPVAFTDSMVIIPTSSPDISNFLKGSSISYNLYWKNRKPTKKQMRLQVRIALQVQ